MTVATESLIEQRNELERQIQEAHKLERKQALKTIKELMAKHGLSFDDIARKAEGKNPLAGLTKPLPSGCKPQLIIESHQTVAFLLLNSLRR